MKSNCLYLYSILPDSNSNSAKSFSKSYFKSLEFVFIRLRYFCCFSVNIPPIPSSNALENPEIQIHKRSGWEMLKALTPPKTKRGAVLIDPSYEEISDYENAAKVICDVLKKWSNGIFMLWYPLLSHREIQINQMLNQITDGAKAVNQNMEILRQELLINTKDAHIETELKGLSKSNPPRLYGSGMLVLNSPWKLKESSDVAVEYFSKLLYEVKK